MEIALCKFIQGPRANLSTLTIDQILVLSDQWEKGFSFGIMV